MPENNGKLKCIKCRKPASYVCHHCGAPLCGNTPQVDLAKARRKEIKMLKKDLEARKYHAVPLSDVVEIAIHCPECADKFHGKGKQGYLQEIRMVEHMQPGDH